MKNLLVVTYYWLPDGGTGTYRVGKFVKYLLRNNWKITVLTACQDSTPEYFLHPNLKVHSTPGNPKKLGRSNKVNPSIFYAAEENWRARLKVWVRLNLVVPDAKILWYFKALKLGLKLARQEKFTALFSTSPPPSTAWIARAIAKKTGLPWTCDFRDPWTEIYYYETFPQGFLARKLNKWMEAEVLKTAKALVCVNKGFFPAHEQKGLNFHYISNGYDPEDFKALSNDPSTRNDKFTIRYVGSFKMNQLSQGFKDLIQSIPESKRATIRFDFVGTVDPLVQAELNRIVPNELECNYLGMKEHREAVQLMQSADLLLLLIGEAQRSKLVFSTKLFEYLKSGNQCLAFGHEGGAAQQIIQKAKGGYLSAHKEHIGALEFLETQLELWQNEDASRQPDMDALQEYSFENLTLRLQKVIENNG